MKHLILIAVMFGVATLTGLRAEPGYGEPLNLTRGATTQVSTFADFKQALDAANSGGVPTTILLEDGNYVMDVNHLAVRCPGLVIRSASGNRDAVIVRGPNEGTSASAYNVFTVEANDVVIADISLGRCRWHGIQARGEAPYDVSGLHVHNCRIFDCNEQFIKGSSSTTDTVGITDGIIENCLFEFTSGWAYQYYTGGIDIHKGVNWRVRDNLFRNIRSLGSNPCEHAIHFWKRCTTRAQNIVVERNHIINCDRGIGFGLGDFSNGLDGGSSTIRNNMIYNVGIGSGTDVGIGLESANDVTVDNNTVFIPSYWAPIEYRFTSSTNLTFRNNLTDKPIKLRDGAPTATQSGTVSNAIASWFQDASTGDLHILPGIAQVIDQGVAVPGFSDDMDGNSRPIGSAWDIGADEYEPPHPVDVWKTNYFRNIEEPLAADDLDPDHDGIPTLFEYVLGSDPTKGNAFPITPDIAPGGQFEMSYTAPADLPAGVVIAIEGGNDLETWTDMPIGGASEEVTENTIPSGTDLIYTYRQNVPVDEPGSNRFMRIRVTRE